MKGVIMRYSRRVRLAIHSYMVFGFRIMIL